MNACFECGVCWYRYVPAEGDDVWQIPPGTAFSDLPAIWRCPRCDGAREGFLRAPDEASELAPGDALALRIAALEALYASIGEARMRGLPIFNEALRVEAVDFAEEGDAWLGVIITPWFMNAVRLPRIASAWRERPDGEVVKRTFPSGSYDFTLTKLADFGAIERCSLISPMAAFEEQDVARMVAQQARVELLRPPADASSTSEPRVLRDATSAVHPVSRRGLLRGRLAGGG